MTCVIFQQQAVSSKLLNSVFTIKPLFALLLIFHCFHEAELVTHIFIHSQSLLLSFGLVLSCLLWDIFFVFSFGFFWQKKHIALEKSKSRFHSVAKLFTESLGFILSYSLYFFVFYTITTAESIETVPGPIILLGEKIIYYSSNNLGKLTYLFFLFSAIFEVGHFLRKEHKVDHKVSPSEAHVKQTKIE